MTNSKLETLLDTFPDYAQDIRLNLSSALRQSEMSEIQLWGTLVACSAAIHCAPLREALWQEACPQHLSAENFRAAKGAAAVMAMNNVYYRFLHLAASSPAAYRDRPARLRMNFLKSHGVDTLDFELWCLAVSALNACEYCVESHERLLREKGVGEEVVLSAVRVAAIVHAAGAVLQAESQE